MRREISLTLSLALLLNLVGCSKSTTNTDVTTRELVLDDAIVISTISTEESSESSVTEETTEVYTTQYQIKDCELEIDKDNHTIKGDYVDKSYKIDFDLTYYDYGVDTVAIYKGVPNGVQNIEPMELTDGEWAIVVDDVFGLIEVYDADKERKELSIQAALSYENELLASNDDLSDVLDKIREYGDYSFFPYYCSYDFPVAEMHASGSYTDNEDYFYHAFYEKDPTAESAKLITLRTELDGLPVGVPNDNNQTQDFLHYGDYTGGFYDYSDGFRIGYYNKDICTLVDFICSTNFDVELMDSSEASVIPIEDCILNSVPSIIYYDCGGVEACKVYATELVYMPLYPVTSLNTQYYQIDPYFVPVWAVYVVTRGQLNDNLRAWTIYLNATTGELISHAGEDVDYGL